LLVKPGDTCEEALDGRLCHREPVGPQAVAEEVEALLDAPDEGLVRVLLQSERRSTVILVGGALLVDVVVASVVHLSRLRRLGFPDAFRRRLAAISYLAGEPVLMVVAGVALKGR